MKIRALEMKDRPKLLVILAETRAFTAEEIEVAADLIDTVLRDAGQRDYHVHCAVDERDEPVGYVCYGPSPMTQGTFDLYWIAVAPGVQGKGMGSRLLGFLEQRIRGMKGRMILVDTSSLPSYEKAQAFYLRRGFREVGRVPGYYWPDNDRITLCKKLDEKG